MLRPKDEQRLAIMEAKQVCSFSPDRQIHIDALRRRRDHLECKESSVLVVEIDQDIFNRGTPDEPTGTCFSSYVEPTKRSAGEYSAYLANQKCAH